MRMMTRRLIEKKREKFVVDFNYPLHTLKAALIIVFFCFVFFFILFALSVAVCLA